MLTRNLFMLSLVLLFSGCVSVETGLKVAEFGVRVGFDIHNYAEEKRKEAKEILDQNGTHNE